MRKCKKEKPRTQPQPQKNRKQLAAQVAVAVSSRMVRQGGDPVWIGTEIGQHNQARKDN